MIQINFRSFALSALLLLSTAPSSSSASDKRCDARTIQGSFGYTVTGFINDGAVPALPPGPFAAVGRLGFDGRNGVSTVRSLSANGIIFRNDVGSGSYTVRSDCTGSFNISIATPNGNVALNLDMVVSDEGDQIRAIVTNAGYILTLQGAKQSDH